MEEPVDPDPEEPFRLLFDVPVLPLDPEPLEPPLPLSIRLLLEEPVDPDPEEPFRLLLDEPVLPLDPESLELLLSLSSRSFFSDASTAQNERSCVSHICTVTNSTIFDFSPEFECFHSLHRMREMVGWNTAATDRRRHEATIDIKHAYRLQQRSLGEKHK